MKPIFLTFFILVAILSATCSFGDPIVGQWERIGGREEIIGGPTAGMAFGKDGDYVLNWLIRGKWRRLDADRIEITTEWPGAKSPTVEIYWVLFIGESMNLTNEKGNITKWRRYVKSRYE